MIGDVYFQIIPSTVKGITAVSFSTQYQKKGCSQGTGSTYEEACEAAAEATLREWCGIERKPPSNPKGFTSGFSTSAHTDSQEPLSREHIVGAKRKFINLTEDSGSNNSNSTALFHMYLSALATDAMPPDFEMIRVNKATFACVLKLTLHGKKIESHGSGPNKVMAKREACGEVLK